MEANPSSPEKKNKNIFGVLPYIVPEVLIEIVTGFPPYSDIPHNKYLALKICNGLRPKIPFHIPKLIAKNNYEVPPTFEELRDEFREYYRDYGDYFEGKNKDPIGIQIKKAEEFSENQESTNTTTTTTRIPLNYQTHPQEIYTRRLLNYSNLPKPKNEEIFKRNLKN
ncbi:hypothetical protein Glove_87g26 [Diversispora epigaea]|uniref:Protein kinase domain-containing protein n=1 Tax=Diversispora epigaea TaxID=1348612 RepID=A0A397JG08_9GLOM|nr:hypothetical protein Glove_87g26 [Diversispora epigaea]